MTEHGQHKERFGIFWKKKFGASGKWSNFGEM